MTRVRTILAPAVAAAALLAALPASAGSITAFTGRVDPDVDGFDAATTGGIRLGNEIFDVGLAEFDLEFEAATDIDAGSTRSGRDWHYRSFGAYLTARSAGPIYFVGRYGVARNTIDVDGNGGLLGGGSDKETANQQSIGLGVGASIGLLQLEVMASQQEKSGDLEDTTWITAGLRF